MFKAVMYSSLSAGAFNCPALRRGQVVAAVKFSPGRGLSPFTAPRPASIFCKAGVEKLNEAFAWPQDGLASLPI